MPTTLLEVCESCPFFGSSSSFVDFKYLHRYLDAGVTHLCLSDRGSKVIPWLKECWRHLPPGIRVHLLGATDRKVLTAVPA